MLGEPDTAEKVDLADYTPADPQGQQLDTVDAVEGVIMPGASAVVDDMIGQLARWAEEDSEGSEDALQQIVATAWQAKDTDQLLTGSGALHARDVLNKPIYVQRVTVVESDIEGEDNCPFYMVMHGTMAPHATPAVVTCGGWRVVAELANMRRRGDFPRAVMIVPARKKSVNGRMPLKLAYPA